MLTQAAIRLWPRAFAVALLAVAGTARAQYRGGLGDGYSAAGVSSVYLDGGLAVSPAYFSTTAGGDGYDVAGKGNVMLSGGNLPAALFTSSTAGGDGYHVAGRAHLALDGASLPAALFVSSTTGGDGYDVRGLANRSLDGTAALLAAYSGSPAGGDGYDTRGIFDIPLDAALAFQFIFSGGIGDGYDVKGLTLTTLDGTVADPSPYFASHSGGDGYDRRGLLNFSLDGAVLPASLFVSSPAGGDGYDTSGTSFVDLSGAGALLVTFLGSNGDGYHHLSLANTLLDPSLALPALVFNGGLGDGYDTASVPYILFLGDGGAAAPMTYAIWRDVHFTSGEISSGLAADSADPDRDGLPNIIEYTTGGDPRTADAGIFGPQFRLSDLSDFGRPALPDKHLTAIIRRDPRIFDADLTVEFSSDAGSLWNTTDTVPVDEVSSLFIVRDRLGVQEAPRRLLRLRATVHP